MLRSNAMRATLKRLDADTVTTCTIQELSGKWITIEPAAQLPQGAPVQIEFNGSVGLGEATQLTNQRCRIQLEHIFKPEDASRFFDNAGHEVCVRPRRVHYRMRATLAIIMASMTLGVLFQAHFRNPFSGEPSTFLLAISGMVVLVLLRGRRARGAID
ncbi:MAG: hypothetical protein ACM3S5_06010 [Rhodospirillales bacterium]